MWLFVLLCVCLFVLCVCCSLLCACLFCCACLFIVSVHRRLRHVPRIFTAVHSTQERTSLCFSNVCVACFMRGCRFCCVVVTCVVCFCLFSCVCCYSLCVCCSPLCAVFVCCDVVRCFVFVCLLFCCERTSPNHARTSHTHGRTFQSWTYTSTACHEMPQHFQCKSIELDKEVGIRRLKRSRHLGKRFQHNISAKQLSRDATAFSMQKYWDL